jgi:hypothetical protein
MNDKLDKLFAAARQATPDTTRAEFGFETRLLARLRSGRSAPAWQFVWRLVPVFAMVVIAVAVWNRSVFTPVSIETALGAPVPASFLGE